MSWKVSKSNIHGLGVFASVNIKPNQIIEKVISLHNGATAFFSNDEIHDHEINGQPFKFGITPFGSKLNHQSHPKANTKLFRMDDSYFLLSIRPIVIGEELTIDYDTLPSFLAGSKKNYK